MSYPPTYPREGFVSLGGIPWLARMIDKARLDAENALEPLDLEYPCPMDQGLLGRLGIDPKTFQAIVVTAESDEAILNALVEKGVSFPSMP